MLSGERQHPLFEVVGVAVGEIEVHQDHVDFAGFQKRGESAGQVVARDPHEPALAGLLLLQKPSEDAVGIAGLLDVALAEMMEIEEVGVVGLESPERLGELLFGLFDRVGPDLGCQDDVLASAAEGQAHALFGVAVPFRGVDEVDAQV